MKPQLLSISALQQRSVIQCLLTGSVPVSGKRIVHVVFVLFANVIMRPESRWGTTFHTLNM